MKAMKFWLCIFFALILAKKESKKVLLSHKNNLKKFLKSLDIGEFEVSDLFLYSREYSKSLWLDVVPFSVGYVVVLPKGVKLDTIRKSIGARDTSWDGLLESRDQFLSRTDMNIICKKEGVEDSECPKPGKSSQHPRYMNKISEII